MQSKLIDVPAKQKQACAEMGEEEANGLYSSGH